MTSAGKSRLSMLGNRCCGCGACSAKCPKKCINMRVDISGFQYPVVDEDACIACGMCESVCPAISIREKDSIEFVAWAKSLDSQNRAASSSGGVFALLAQAVLSTGGIVVGAAWEHDYKSVKHVIVDDQANLCTIMRSKYVQSNVGNDVYIGVRSALTGGRRVLFCGTACQVAGMNAFLGSLAQSDLYLSADVICHGVPSPLLWKKWINYKEAHAHGRITGVNMRSKATGWLTYSTAYSFESDAPSINDTGSSTLINDGSIFTKDWFMKAFLSNACLRPSCFNCPAKRMCGSDITLGDFWGIQEVHPNVDYEGGVSAVICSSSRGLIALDGIKQRLAWGESTFEDVARGNPSLLHSVAPYCNSDCFMEDVTNDVSIVELMNRYTFVPSIWERVCKKLDRIKKQFASVF